MTVGVGEEVKQKEKKKSPTKPPFLFSMRFRTKNWLTVFVDILSVKIHWQGRRNLLIKSRVGWSK